jgi:hypothetical protein
MFLDFKKWVKSIQTVGYNGARMVFFSPKCITALKFVLVCCLVRDIGDRVGGETGWAIAHPGFGRSVKPHIPTQLPTPLLVIG